MASCVMAYSCSPAIAIGSFNSRRSVDAYKSFMCNLSASQERDSSTFRDVHDMLCSI